MLSHPENLDNHACFPSVGPGEGSKEGDSINDSLRVRDATVDSTPSHKACCHSSWEIICLKKVQIVLRRDLCSPQHAWCDICRFLWVLLTIYMLWLKSQSCPWKAKTNKKKCYSTIWLSAEFWLSIYFGFFPNISQYSILENPNLVLFHHIIYYQTPQNDKHSDTRHGDWNYSMNALALALNHWTENTESVSW